MQQILDSIQIEEGSNANQYTPYGTTPIELNKIGTYQDYIYKENDKWYLHKETGKVVFDGSESWQDRPNFNDCDRFVLNTTAIPSQTIDGLSNYFIVTNASYNVSTIGYLRTSQGDQIIINFSTKGTTSLAQFKTWLGNNKPSIYYILSSATNTEITYTPLIEQLNTIKQAQSKEGTTNVNQVNNDAPFMLDLSVFNGSDTLTINNIGNAPSKPVITLVGSGNVGLYLNDIQVFQISLGTNETIILDTENMEAYYGSQLKNRQVIGDYNSFALQSGENTIRFTGSVSYIEITNYTRWI
jgi:phage-related protein